LPFALHEHLIVRLGGTTGARDMHAGSGGGAGPCGPLTAPLLQRHGTACGPRHVHRGLWGGGGVRAQLDDEGELLVLPCIVAGRACVHTLHNARTVRCSCRLQG
jgi:hypothetical protein